MATSFLQRNTILRTALRASMGLAFVAACLTAPSSPAYAVTAAEKQAEADAVFAQIDSLQTSLNNSLAEYERAQSGYEEACELRDEAQRNIEAESEHIAQIQEKLADFAVGMYKQGAGSYIDVILDSQTFEDFLTAWDTCNTIFVQGDERLLEARRARASYEASQRQYEAQMQRAEDEMAAAEAARIEIEQTREALRAEAEQLSAEAAELQRQEELAAEAARQAEEARLRREAELAAAAKAEEERAAREAAAAEAAREANETGGEIVIEAATVEEGEDASSDLEAEMIDTEAAEVEPEPEPIVVGPGFFANPCPGAAVSSEFGYRTFDNSFHMGLDLSASEGTPYYAAASGTVMFATNDGGYNGGAGNWVVIAHGNGIVTKYMHSSATFVNPGDYVEAGQNIGLVGNTGQSFGAHLHFQVEIGGVAVNPLNYM